MAKKILVFVAALTLVIIAACKKEETNINTGPDTAVVTAGETDVTIATDTVATDTMATDTSYTSGGTMTGTSGTNTTTTSTTSTTTHT
jgi:hypothetical protein